MKVKKILMLETLNDYTDVLTVIFEDETTALMFYKYADAIKYIDQEVIVEFRDDIYKGVVQRFINTLTETVKVNTIERDKEFKLFAVGDSNESNVTFADLKVGDVKLNAVMYCTAQEFKSSERTISTWAELTVRDAAFKYLKLRLFDYEPTKSNFVNRYIKCDISRSVYGLSTQEIQIVEGQPEVSADVELAINYIKHNIAKDTEIISIFEKLNLIDVSKKYNDTHGYGHSLIEMAFELSLLETYKNMIPKVNWDLITKAIILSHLYVCNSNSTLSRNLQNIVKLSSLQVTGKNHIMHIYDEINSDTENLMEKRLYYLIKENAKEVIRARYWI